MATKPRSTASRTAEDKGMLNRLKDQLAVQKKVKSLTGDGIHLNARVLHEQAFYPAHDKRTETPEYKQIHHHMAVELDLPCLVCGVRNSTLQDKTKNRYGAKAMETHHHVIEWALANAVDTAKFNGTILPNLAHKHPENPDYKKPFSDQQVKDWVDHSSDNLWVLCDVHHRAAYFGIHEITYPIWAPMDLLRSDFEQYVQQQISAAKGTRPARAATRRTPARRRKPGA
jgi:hypothetical protein